ncbi:hypothetical protein AB5J56_08730 [Streptomyces sp. R21]|uniref:SMODS-associating 2TM beta-strand rich effector domain-containing protein n=1 Tax=Streptomyces sp. R21 TaxID=3238627 RepID=A0AB39P2M6_9ACTN
MGDTLPAAVDEPTGRNGLRRWCAKFAAYLLLVPAVISYAVSRYWLDGGEFHNAAAALGESFLVAAVLAVSGDFYLKYKLYEAAERKSLGQQVGEMFGFLDPNQPQQLQDAVMEFSEGKSYLRSSHWHVAFDWEGPDVLRLNITVIQDGRSIGRDGLRFIKPPWILRSVDGFPSAFTYYGLSCPQSRVRVDEGEEVIRSYALPFREDDSRVSLNQARLIAEKSPQEVIARGHDFTARRSARMYRHATDYVPLSHGAFAIDVHLELSGSALQDLTVSAFTPKSSVGDQERVFQAAEGGTREVVWHNVTPNQATIVSWRRKSDALT